MIDKYLILKIVNQGEKMATVNIFTSVDVVGLVENYKTTINSFWVKH